MNPTAAFRTILNTLGAKLVAVTEEPRTEPTPSVPAVDWDATAILVRRHEALTVSTLRRVGWTKRACRECAAALPLSAWANELQLVHTLFIDETRAGRFVDGVKLLDLAERITMAVVALCMYDEGVL